MANFCNQCGSALAVGAKFCPGCGTAAENGAPAAASAPQNVQYVPVQPVAAHGGNSNLGWIVAGIAGALLLAGALYWAISGRSGGASTAAPVAAGLEGAALGPEVAKYIISDANIRNVATAKGAESQVVGSLKKGVQVKGTMHTGASGDSQWFKLSDGRGFVSAVNLSDAPPVVGATAPVAAAAPVAPKANRRAPIPGASYCQVATKGGNLRIRNAPDGPIVGGLPKGARFQAYSNEQGMNGELWYQIQPEDTRYPGGWVSGRFIAC